MIVRTVPTSDQILKTLSEKELADFIKDDLEAIIKKTPTNTCTN